MPSGRGTRWRKRGSRSRFEHRSPQTRLVALLALSVLLLAFPSWLGAQSDIIERIEIQGNSAVDEGTYLFHITSKVGEPYDRERALDDFQRLWETGFLDDLTLEVDDGERGKIVRFIVEERPRVRGLDYIGSEALSPGDIQDKLKEEDAEIKIDSFYEPARVVKVEKIIRQMLVDKGLSNGNVESDVKDLDERGVQIVFQIRDEQKINIKTITFEGIDEFDNWRLRWGLEKTKESHTLGFLTGGSLYTDEKLAEDLEKVREIYLNEGYVDVGFGEPEMRYEEGHSRFLFWKKPKTWLHLTVPVEEGKQYRVGEVSVDGATVFPPEFVKSFFDLSPGEVYNESKVIKGLDKLRELYGARGYVQFTGFPVKRPVGGTDQVNVTINLQEDKQFFVNRIEFEGNTTTRDKVIRREIWLNEQDVMNMELLKMSIRRINQLGYFRPIEAPEIRPAEGEDNKLDIVL